MHDSYLFKRISDSLVDMCEENGVKKITFVEINVHYSSRINSKNLQDFLIAEIPTLVDENTKVVVEVVDSIEDSSALILAVEGYKD